MHTNRISPARKIILGLAATLALFLLPGCETVTLTNLTPASMPENPSQIYTFTLRVTPRTNTVMKSSIAPTVVLDGQSHRMNQSALGQGLYEFEYQVPAGRDEVRYYFLVNYAVEGNAVATPREAYIDVASAKIVRRYVLSLEVNRGPVGARISVLGRGFTAQDIISFNGTPAQTTMESPNALSFSVPPLEPNRNYQVTLSSASGNSPVGTFRIDGSGGSFGGVVSSASSPVASSGGTVSVVPTSLTLRTGSQQTLTFTLPNAAPPGGTLLDISTDIPESVIMPEVVVPAGQTSVIVAVEGGRPGNGNLFLKGYSGGELTIPLSVTAR